MSALTVQQIIIEGLRELEIAAAGEPVEPEDLQTGLLRFNMFLDTWKAQRLMIFKVLRELYTVSANVTSYTIGPGATWNTPTMPLAIVRAGFVNTAVNPSNPLETPIRVYTDEEWARIGQKTMTSTIVWGVWYRTDFTTNGATPPSGTGTIFVFPICTTSGQVALYLPVAIDEVDDSEGHEADALATTIIVPPGYRKAMVTTMAMEMADVFGVTPSANLTKKWNSAMKVVKRANSKAATLALPAALLRRARGTAAGSGYNILTNQ